MVNTFLPYADFGKSAECLDYRRLGKQRVEARQIITAIERLEEYERLKKTIKHFNGKKPGWSNHTAANMWKGYIPALKHYYNIMVLEWVSRGYNNTMELYDIEEDIIMPWWFGNTDFHYSHQASLLRKYNEYYNDEFSYMPDSYKDKGYVWPKIVDGVQVIEFSPVQTIRK